MTRFTSHAQNFEDVILWRALNQVRDGFYIDVGANDPITDSVTLAFYERGWWGIHIEPMQIYADALRRERQEDRIIEAAVSNTGPHLTLFEVENTGLTTSIRQHANTHIKAELKP